MSKSFSQIYIQLVFAVKFRESLITKNHKALIYSYMAGIIKAKGHKPIIINGMPDHVHVFVGLNPVMAISDLVRDVKNNSSKFINEEKIFPAKFQWQDGFGAFSYSQSHVDNVYKYIENQEEHHKKQTFKDEYLGFLNRFEIEFDERKLFNWLDLSP